MSYEYATSLKSKHVYRYTKAPDDKLNKWYFSDETEWEHGPYTSEVEAYEAFTIYCETL